MLKGELNFPEKMNYLLQIKLNKNIKTIFKLKFKLQNK